MKIYRLKFGRVRVADIVYPVYAYLVCLSSGQNILIDSGASMELNQLMTKYKLWTEFNLDSDLSQELHKLQFEISDIDILIQTHLHHDHVASLEFFDFERQKVIVAKQEVRSLPKRKFTIDYNVNYLRDYIPYFTLVDFENTDIIPLSDSITLVKTANHTKGHLSVAIVDNNENAFFTGDSFYTAEAMLNGLKNVQSKDPQLYERLKSLFEKENYAIYFSHCDEVLSSKEVLKGC